MSSSSNQMFNVETLCDADDLMSWLLLHPEMVEFTEDPSLQYQSNLQRQNNESGPSIGVSTVPFNQNTVNMMPAPQGGSFYGDTVPMNTYPPIQQHIIPQPLDQSQQHAQSLQTPYQQNMVYINNQQNLSHLPPINSQPVAAPGMMPMAHSYQQVPINSTAPPLKQSSIRVKRELNNEDSTASVGKAQKTKHGQSISAATSSNGSTAPSKNRVVKATKKKQRESIEDLEASVNQLKSENTDLQAHLMNVMQRTTEVQKQRSEMERQMIAKMSTLSGGNGLQHSGGSGKSIDLSSTKAINELAEIVKKYTDIYADYGKCRQREVAFHLNQLEKLLLPTQTTKMSLWALQQDKSFFQRNSSPMFNILSETLDLSTEQVEKIQDRRERTNHLLAQLKESLSLITTLKTAIERKHECYDGICGRVQEAATPIQIVHFLVWISKNAERLARFIPAFSRNVHHTPNVEFIDGGGKSGDIEANSGTGSGPVLSDGSTLSILPNTLKSATASAGPFSGETNSIQ